MLVGGFGGFFCLGGLLSGFFFLELQTGILHLVCETISASVPQCTQAISVVLRLLKTFSQNTAKNKTTLSVVLF